MISRIRRVRSYAIRLTRTVQSYNNNVTEARKAHTKTGPPSVPSTSVTTFPLPTRQWLCVRPPWKTGYESPPRPVFRRLTKSSTKPHRASDVQIVAGAGLTLASPEEIVLEPWRKVTTRRVCIRLLSSYSTVTNKAKGWKYSEVKSENGQRTLEWKAPSLKMSTRSR